MNTVLLQAAPSAGGGLISMVLIYGVVIGLMWFILIRPQKKQQKQITEMQNSVKVGDSILLNSGMYGKVMDIIGETLIVEFGLNKFLILSIDFLFSESKNSKSSFLLNSSIPKSSFK